MRQAVVQQPKNSSIDGDDAHVSERVRGSFSGRHLFFACLLLLGVTWIPIFIVHFHRQWVDNDASGTVVVIYPLTTSTETIFRNIIDADGAIVRPVTWAPRVWVAQSVQPGFAGRLRKSGAWGVYSVNLLSANALFSCFRITSTLPPAR